MRITNRAEGVIEQELSGIITIIEEEKNKIISDEEVMKTSSNPYREQLVQINNPFADWDLEMFYNKHTKRISNYSKNIKSSEMYITYIREFLEILTDIEQDPDIKWKENSFPSNRFSHSMSSSHASIFKQASYGGTSRYCMYKYQSTRLPHCCGVSEYGEFGFAEYSKVEGKLVYNLMLDLIRLTAHIYRKQYSGAVGIINYFIKTPFMETLISRDDLQFIREFTNPKTGATLNMFMFETKI